MILFTLAENEVYFQSALRKTKSILRVPSAEHLIRSRSHAGESDTAFPGTV